jgi:uncharacterized membrane protein YeaQ/YmgE (transglycosylase-associated protein family)
MLLWIISGIIAGWLTGLVMRGRGFGVIGDLVVGLIGGIIGGSLAGFLGIVPTSLIGHILVAALGGVVLVAIIRALRRV